MHTFVGSGEQAWKSRSGLYVPVNILSSSCEELRQYGTNPGFARKKSYKQNTYSAMLMHWRKVANGMHIPVCSDGDTARTFCRYIYILYYDRYRYHVARVRSPVPQRARFIQVPNTRTYTHTLRWKLRSTSTVNMGDVYVLDLAVMNSRRQTAFVPVVS